MRQIFQNNYSALGNVTFRRRALERAKEYSSDTLGSNREPPIR